MTKPSYSIIIPHPTVGRAAAYLQKLRGDLRRSGAFLRGVLEGDDLGTMSEQDLLGRLYDTKQPQIFAEIVVAGDGSDWNLTELGLLGDISMAVPVEIFDDGSHVNPTPHEPPFPGVLIFTPGALLRNGRSQLPADWGEITSADGQVSAEGYYNLYQRRLLPVFQYINAHAAKARSAFITIPGLGCGQFAGPFRGQLGTKLQAVLKRLLTEYGASLPNLKAVYFDPYNEGENARDEIHGISFMVRPLTAVGSRRNPQLCYPETYAEQGDNFSDCVLYSLVAWDHVSWPGNDFFIGSRMTDDGVKAAATTSMAVLTGIQGQYDAVSGKYQPPRPHRDWKELAEQGVRTRGLRLWDPAALWYPSGSM